MRVNIVLWFACAATLVFGVAASGAAQPQTTNVAALLAAQGSANSKPGPRTVPARLIPVPNDLDSDAATLIRAPYWPYWNMNPPNRAAWRATIVRAAKATLPDLIKARAALGVSVRPTRIGGVKAFMVTPKAILEAHKNQLVVNFHGGGYVFSPGESGTAEAVMLAAYGGYKVLAIDYRMPPDAPFPAAMDDATAAWRAVVATTDPRHIAVEGTSSGGGMVLALMLRAKAEGLPMPGAIAPCTPWSDMTETGDSYRTNEWVDNVLVSYDGYLGRAAKLYANGHDLKDPQLSPIYGDFHGLPPAILTAGTRDLFLSTTVRAHRKMRDAGVDADLEIYEGISHAQFLFDTHQTLAKNVYRQITRFFDAHLQH